MVDATRIAVTGNGYWPSSDGLFFSGGMALLVIPRSDAPYRADFVVEASMDDGATWETYFEVQRRRLRSRQECSMNRQIESFFITSGRRLRVLVSNFVSEHQIIFEQQP